MLGEAEAVVWLLVGRAVAAHVDVMLGELRGRLLLSSVAVAGVVLVVLLLPVAVVLAVLA